MYQDTIPVLNTEAYCPWRRYFARMTDLVVYSIFTCVIMGYGFGVNLTALTTWQNTLDVCLTTLLMLLIEPLLLSQFGTTLGKAVFGLRVESDRGRKLRYSEGFLRTLWMLWSGLGLNIPIYTIYRLYKSHSNCRDGEPMPWDEDSKYIVKDSKPWRWLLFLVVQAICIGAIVLVALGQLIPPNRGALTVAEFSENFNYYCNYTGFDASGHSMAEDGTWEERVTPVQTGTTVVLFEMGSFAMPEFTFTCNDAGEITQIDVLANSTDCEWTAPQYQFYQAMAGNAVLCAQESFPVNVWSDYNKRISLNAHKNVEYQKGNVSIAWNVAYEGYESQISNGLMFVQDEENTYTLTGTIQIAP